MAAVAAAEAPAAEASAKEARTTRVRLGVAIAFAAGVEFEDACEGLPAPTLLLLAPFTGDAEALFFLREMGAFFLQDKDAFSLQEREAGASPPAGPANCVFTWRLE